jgi:formate--tetrahydrofolate ligase
MHAGPFGNIAQGTSSVIADRLGLKLFDLVVTEAGFGADLGAEKFFDIKLRQSGLRPAAAVVVATVRALKMHGGVGKIVAGKPLDRALEVENVEAVRRGAENLAKQIENVREFGVPVVVAINHFPTDTEAEIAAIAEVAQAAGARATVVSRHFAEGGKGAEGLAAAVRDAANEGAPQFRLLYPDEMPLVEKVERLATRMYGADGIEVLPKAGKQFEALEKLGYGRLPICMAKTHLSLSHDPTLKGRPRGFKLPVREARLAAGAGFVTVLAGDIRLMPGLSSRPSGEQMDLDDEGQVVGLH